MAKPLSSRIGLTVISGLLTSFIFILLLYMYLWLHLPDVSTLIDTPLQAPLRIYSHDHQLIAEYGEKQRIPVKLSAIPKTLIQAVLATEDQRFYTHNGVDFIGLARAIHQLIITGKKRQGASTITMQVARNFYLSREKTYTRKLNEILLAIKIDHQLTKNEILTLYLNKIYFGQRAYGVAAAARNYYGRSLQQLSLAEIAMIAGLPKAPSKNNPIKRPQASIKRRNHVLTRLYTSGKINHQQYDSAINAPITASIHRFHVKLHAPFVAEAVRKQLYKRYGPKVYSLGLNVFTSIQAPAQRIAEHSLLNGIYNYDKRHGYRFPTLNLSDQTDGDITSWPQLLESIPATALAQPGVVLANQDEGLDILLASNQVVHVSDPSFSWLDDKASRHEKQAFKSHFLVGDVVHVGQLGLLSWKLTQIPKIQGCIVSLDPDTGAIEALVGGFDFKLSSFDRAIQAMRQPGSSIKPFIFSTALDHGLTLATQINDAPIVEYDFKTESLWRPQNDTRKFYGPTSLRTALIHSRNLVSIRLLKILGINTVRDQLARFGFKTKQLPKTLSLALGTGLVSPWQLTGSYATFANTGYKIRPHLIEQVNDQKGHVIYSDHREYPPPYQHVQLNKVRAISEANAFLITDALRTVITQGTGRFAKKLKRRYIAGKTGTTNEQRDAWFVGFSRHHVATVWLGFDNNASLKEYASKAALPIWTEFMGSLLAGKADIKFKQPKNIVPIRINTSSGLRTSTHTAHSRFEYFRKRYIPTYDKPVSLGASSAPDWFGERESISNEDLF